MICKPKSIDFSYKTSEVYIDHINVHDAQKYSLIKIKIHNWYFKNVAEGKNAKDIKINTTGLIAF